MLPYDAEAVPAGAAILLDATVYVDQLKGDLPRPIVNLIAGRPVRHGAPALSELAAAIGRLDPSDPRTAANLMPIIETLERVPPQMILVPSDEAWIEASILAGILARTQGIPKAERPRLLNDALLFLSAAESGATLISRNANDFDLLLQMKPGVPVLLYDR
jgi:predicted nucleic acid-binding protein